MNFSRNFEPLTRPASMQRPQFPGILGCQSYRLSIKSLYFPCIQKPRYRVYMHPTLPYFGSIFRPNRPDYGQTAPRCTCDTHKRASNFCMPHKLRSHAQKNIIGHWGTHHSQSLCLSHESLQGTVSLL